MKFKLLFVYSLFILLTVQTYGGGTELYPLTGTKTFSLNGLYFAGFDGISKTLTNPAALIFVNNTLVDFNILDRLSQTKFESTSNGIHRTFRNDDFIISGGVLWSLTEDIKVGLSYQPAVNYNVEWPYAKFFQQGDSASQLLVFDFFNRVKIEAFAPTAAFRFGDFSIGISPIVYRIKSETAFPITNENWQGITSAAYQLFNSQKGWGYGVSVGIITTMFENITAALSVRSGYSSDLKGTGKSNFFSEIDSTTNVSDINSKIEIPWIFGLGAIYNFSPGLKLNLDVQYSLWGSIRKNSPQTYSNSIWQNRLSTRDQLTGLTGNNINYNYKNALDFGVGLEYITESDYSYRFGYRYNGSPNSTETYTMLFPTVNQHWLSVGFGLVDENINLEGTLAYSFSTVKSISNNSTNNGEYSYGAIVPMVTLRYLIR